MAKKDKKVLTKKRPPTPSESEGEDFDDYDEEEESDGPIEDISGRIVNDYSSDEGEGSDDDEGDLSGKGPKEDSSKPVAASKTSAVKKVKAGAQDDEDEARAKQEA